MDVIEALTPREREVLTLIADGLNDAEIERHIGIVHSTLRCHLASLYRHLGVSSRIQAAMIVWQRQIKCLEAENITLRQLVAGSCPELQQLDFHITRAAMLIKKFK